MSTASVGIRASKPGAGIPNPPGVPDGTINITGIADPRWEFINEGNATGGLSKVIHDGQDYHGGWVGNRIDTSLNTFQWRIQSIGTWYLNLPTSTKLYVYFKLTMNVNNAQTMTYGMNKQTHISGGNWYPSGQGTHYSLLSGNMPAVNSYQIYCFMRTASIPIINSSIVYIGISSL